TSSSAAASRLPAAGSILSTSAACSRSRETLAGAATSSSHCSDPRESRVGYPLPQAPHRSRSPHRPHLGARAPREVDPAWAHLDAAHLVGAAAAGGVSGGDPGVALAGPGGPHRVAAAGGAGGGRGRRLRGGRRRLSR